MPPAGFSLLRKTTRVGHLKPYLFFAEYKTPCHLHTCVAALSWALIFFSFFLFFHSWNESETQLFSGLIKYCFGSWSMFDHFFVEIIYIKSYWSQPWPICALKLGIAVGIYSDFYIANNNKKNREYCGMIRPVKKVNVINELRLSRHLTLRAVERIKTALRKAFPWVSFT